MGSASYLNDLAATILATAEDALAQDRTETELPTRRYYAHGEPVHDFCAGGQLAVWHGPVTTLQIRQGSTCAMRPSTTFFVEVARCVPVLGEGGDIPTADELTESAELLGRDLWCLMTWLYQTLPGDLRPCGPIDFGPATALNPSGGMAGWRIPVTVTLNDAGPS